MADFNSSLPVETRTGKYCEVKISDGTDILDILTRDAAYGAATKGAPVFGIYEAVAGTYNDGDATALLTDKWGRLDVHVEGITGGTVTLGGTIDVDVVGGSMQIFGMDAHDDPFTFNPVGIGLEYETVAGLNTVNAAGDISRIKGGAEGVLYADLIDPTQGLRVGIADGAAVAGAQLGFLALGTDGANYQVIGVDTSGNLNVNVVSEVSSNPINDYDTQAALAGAGTDNHDWGNVTGSTFKLMGVEAAASGAMKVEIMTIVAAVQTTEAVTFTSMANPTTQVIFPEPLQLAAGGTIRVARTNREADAMDVYSTINGYA